MPTWTHADVRASRARVLPRLVVAALGSALLAYGAVACAGCSSLARSLSAAAKRTKSGARADQIQASEKLVEEEINSNLRFNVFSSLCNRFVATLDVNGEGRCPKEDFIRKFLQASAPAALTGVTCASGYGYYGYGASASSNGVTFLF